MTKEKDKGWPCVDAFAYDVKKNLDRNDWKGGWRRMSTARLLGLLLEEMRELAIEVETGNPDYATCKRIQSEAADIGAVAMMLHDMAGRKVDKILRSMPPAAKP